MYVQHRLKERAKEVNELLSQKAFFYVCGDAANMAREVNAVLAQIIAEGRGVSEAKAEEIVKGMRSANQYQVRVSDKRWISTKNKWLLTNQKGGRLVLDGICRRLLWVCQMHGSGSNCSTPGTRCLDSRGWLFASAKLD